MWQFQLRRPAPNRQKSETLSLPDNQFENQYLAEGYSVICGLDEVGMGCLAGPVVAAAVILPPHGIPAGLNDSKLLTPKRRELLSSQLGAIAVEQAVAWASVEEIDSLNIFQAARLAMRRAVEKLRVTPQFLLIDGRASIDLRIPQLSIIQGDRKSVSIAAASIIAKVYRDRWMVELDLEYPGYGLSKHKGYGSREHRMNLMRLGRSAIHRESFCWSPVVD